MVHVICLVVSCIAGAGVGQTGAATVTYELGHRLVVLTRHGGVRLVHKLLDGLVGVVIVVRLAVVTHLTTDGISAYDSQGLIV